MQEWLGLSSTSLESLRFDRCERKERSVYSHFGGTEFFLSGGGGLGVRRLGDWNRASLLRLFWEMARGSHALWSQLLRQKYLKNQPIWEVEATSSWVWRSLLSVRELAHGCIIHQIGDGKGTKLWTDPWLPEGRVVSVYGRDLLYSILFRG